MNTEQRLRCDYILETAESLDQISISVLTRASAETFRQEMPLLWDQAFPQQQLQFLQKMCEYKPQVGHAKLHNLIDDGDRYDILKLELSPDDQIELDRCYGILGVKHSERSKQANNRSRIKGPDEPATGKGQEDQLSPTPSFNADASVNDVRGGGAAAGMSASHPQQYAGKTSYTAESPGFNPQAATGLPCLAPFDSQSAMLSQVDDVYGSGAAAGMSASHQQQYAGKTPYTAESPGFNPQAATGLPCLAPFDSQSAEAMSLADQLRRQQAEQNQQQHWQQQLNPPGDARSAADQQRYWKEQQNHPGFGGRGGGGPGF